MPCKEKPVVDCDRLLSLFLAGAGGDDVRGLGAAEILMTIELYSIETKVPLSLFLNAFSVKTKC